MAKVGWVVALLGTLAGCGLAPQRGSAGIPAAAEMPGLVAAASRGDDVAVTRLRSAGRPGLEAVLAAYDGETDVAKKGQLSVVADRVAKQRDARFARLYWHTDLAAAEREARATGRPILSLRMLGELDDELSCANSRFFRTTLYPNRDVQALLRDRFVLHWSSERPAPVMTIDFRDGRIVKRTVTGNSLHYVLDADGRVVDAIPGLWGPQAFVSVVRAAGEEARRTGSLDEPARLRELARFHDQALSALRSEWRTEVASARRPGLPFQADMVLAVTQAPRPVMPPALLALPVAPSKALVELPLVQGSGARMPTNAGVDFEIQAAAGIPWATLAAPHLPSCRLDDVALAAVRSKRPRAWSDARALGRPLDDAELRALVTSYEQTMAEDTVKNAYLHHAVLHGWLGASARSGDGGDAFAPLNARIYASMFRTPAADPWLGLVPPNAYSGIADDGITRP